VSSCTSNAGQSNASEAAIANLLEDLELVLQAYRRLGALRPPPIRGIICDRHGVLTVDEFIGLQDELETSKMTVFELVELKRKRGVALGKMRAKLRSGGWDDL
jgi:hypothetical protein